MCIIGTKYHDIWCQNTPIYRQNHKSTIEHEWFRKSRDSARTPVQWSAEENAGFTSGKPWFYINDNYVDVNVAAQENDENSVLYFYRKAQLILQKYPTADDTMKPYEVRVYLWNQ